MQKKHLFPWWAGYLLLSPLRKLTLDPDMVLGQHVREGMTVLDAGCAMGYFSIPAARMVGSEGKVICIDVQERMLRTLIRRALKAGVDRQIKTRTCTGESLALVDFYGRVDVAVAFGVLHEAVNEREFINDLFLALKQGGTLILGEPKLPVPARVFAVSVSRTVAAGLRVESLTENRSCRLAVFRKK